MHADENIGAPHCDGLISKRHFAQFDELEIYVGQRRGHAALYLRSVEDKSGSATYILLVDSSVLEKHQDGSV